MPWWQQPDAVDQSERDFDIQADSMATGIVDCIRSSVRLARIGAHDDLDLLNQVELMCCVEEFTARYVWVTCLNRTFNMISDWHMC